MRTNSRKTLIFNLLLFFPIVGFGAAQERGIAGTGAGAAGDMKYAVVIGVNRYADSGVGQLEHAVADAEAIHRVLTSAPGGFTPERTVLLTDNQPDERRPTRANILKFLNTFVGLAGSSDTVLVYFAGHGTTENDQLYLLPSDTALSMLGDTAIPFERIKALVEASPAQRKVLILDACHSGAGRSLNRMTEGVGKQFDEASRGMVVLASCGPDEVSREMPDTGHGAFTYFLLEGLAGAADTNGDGFIGAKELSNHTWDHTRLWAAGNGWQQNPWEHSHVSGDIILARPYTSVTDAPPPAPEPAPSVSYQGYTSEPMSVATEDLRPLYIRAQTSYAADNFVSALDLYNQYLAQCPHCELSANAQFWKAKCLYNLNRYDESIQTFEALCAQYPTSTKVPFAMHNQAVAHSRLGQTAEAKRLMQAVIDQYPTSPAAEVARADLRKLRGK